MKAALMNSLQYDFLHKVKATGTVIILAGSTNLKDRERGRGGTWQWKGDMLRSVHGE